MNLLRRRAAPAAADISGWVNSGFDFLALEVTLAGSQEYYDLYYCRLRMGVAEVARLPSSTGRKSGDFRYTQLRTALKILLLVLVKPVLSTAH